jgi:hypothetical protein
MDSRPIGAHSVIPRVRKSENNVVNVVKVNHRSRADPKIDQGPTDKTDTDLVGQLRRFKADGSSAPATAPVQPSEMPGGVITKHDSHVAASQTVQVGRRAETNGKDLASDLKKLRENGAIESMDDAALYSRLLITFGGRYLGKKEKAPEVKPAQPYKPTERQIVKIPFGLTRAQQREFLEHDLKMAFPDNRE